MNIQPRINQIGEWLFRLTILNFLWIGFALLGLGFLGIFPATSALFAVIRQYRLDRKKVKLGHELIHYYKKDFVQANLIGYIFVFLMSVSWIDYRYLLSTQNYWVVSLSMLFLIATLVIIFAVLLVFAFFVHFELPLFKTIMNPFRFMINHLRRSILTIVLLLVWFSFVRHLPGVIPFLSVSVPVFILSRMVEPILMPTKEKGRVKQTNYVMKQEDMLYY